MSTEWIAAESFERAHEVISAINTLSIRTKLALAGVRKSVRDEEFAEARGRLTNFLNRLGTVVRDVERDQEGPILGANPGIGFLARRFVSGKQQQPQHSPLYGLSPEQLSDLINSERREDRKTLIACLADLRSLVEQQAHLDVVGILGEL